MKDKVMPIRISSTEIEEINNQFKQELINNKLISRSEFIRRLLKLGIEAYKKENYRNSMGLY